MSRISPETSIDEYLRERLMPAEGVTPLVPGIEIFGKSVPAGTVGGDLFEYINFQQRYDLDARIQRAQSLSMQFLEPLIQGAPIRNSVDDHVSWMQDTQRYNHEKQNEYRLAKSSEQIRIAEELHNLYSKVGLLIVDAEGHGIISAKIASTVHSTFHALMLAELDHHGKATAQVFENLNLRLGSSVTARNELKLNRGENAREIATMLYGEVHPGGHFRFINFGHPPPLVFSAELRKFVKLDAVSMVQFLALGLQIPEDHPDRKKYYSMNLRKRELNASDVAEISLMGPGDTLLLYTDGVFDGSDEIARAQLEAVMVDHYLRPAQEICNALLDHAIKRDEQLRKDGDEVLIDDKTVLVVKRT